MKNLNFLALAMFVALMGISFTSCTETEGNDDYSFIGTWVQKQGNTEHVVTFERGSVGSINEITYNNNGQISNEERRFFKYDYFEDKNELIIESTSDQYYTAIDGDWTVRVAEKSLILEGFSYVYEENIRYKFDRK